MDKDKRAEYMRDYRLRRREKWAENRAAVEFIKNRHPELWPEWMAYSSGSGNERESAKNPIADIAIMLGQLVGAVDMLAKLAVLEQAEIDRITDLNLWYADTEDTRDGEPTTRGDIYALLRPSEVYHRRAKATERLREWIDRTEEYIKSHYGGDRPCFADSRDAIHGELACHTGEAIII